mmetsp:Transcript_146356/g.467600  ORF Transcript_146356/g.467600 Transcript_146356/m.467600 type:complete len:355 (-) Transcript_146356:173-1237(-)
MSSHLRRPPEEMSQTLLRKTGSNEDKRPAISVELVVLCLAHVVLNASGPIMLHWVKAQNGGTYPFSGAALTFHAYSAAVLLGLFWVGAQGAEGLRQLNRPIMFLKFGALAVLFSAGDTLSVCSMEYLDPATFSLVGKALAMVLAVGLSRIFLGRRQSQAQYQLLGAIILSTLAFCRFEAKSQLHATGVSSRAASATAGAGQLWAWGLALRAAAVLLQSMAAVLQEWLLGQEAWVPFMLQQSWMGCGALTTTFAAWRGMHGQSITHLFDGFDDWRALTLLALYTLNGLTVGLMVKRLGVLAKALCVPVHLGACYIYGVWSCTATLKLEAISAWLISTVLVVMFAVSKAKGRGSAK